MAGNEQQFCLQLLQILQGAVIHDIQAKLVLSVDTASLRAVEVVLVFGFRELQELHAVDLGKEGQTQTPKLLEKGELYFVSPSGPGSGFLLPHSGLLRHSQKGRIELYI